jgi:hypothetical protein
MTSAALGAATMLALLVVKRLIVDPKWAASPPDSFVQARGRLYRSIFIFLAPSALGMYLVITALQDHMQDKGMPISAFTAAVISFVAFGGLYWLLCGSDAELATSKLREGHSE